MIDTYLIESARLLVSRPKGILDAEMCQRIFGFIEIEEVAVETGFNRFFDLTRLDTILLSSADVSALADRRSSFNPNDIPVKSAFWATNSVAGEFAHTYAQLLKSPRIEARVFTDLEFAAEWLGVMPDQLKI
jgi:hypothetical protein